MPAIAPSHRLVYLPGTQAETIMTLGSLTLNRTHLRPRRWLSGLDAAASSARFPVVVAVLLALVLGWQLAAIGWRLVPVAEPGQPAVARIVEPDTVDAGTTGADSMRRLASLHIFGTAPDDADTAAERSGEPEDAPETRLDLDLRGLFAVADGDGYAIIRAGGDGERVFGVGDRLPGNARITGIYGDRVLLRRDGNLEALWLGDARDEAAADQRNEPLNQPETQVAETASTLRSELLEDPGQLARMVRFQPYQQDGELIGFRLRPRGNHGETLRELGLTPEDILTQINGIPLNDPRRGQEALEELRDAREVNVEFLRGGQRMNVTLSLDAPR